jgi:hypothetical protein
MHQDRVVLVLLLGVFRDIDNVTAFSRTRSGGDILPGAATTSRGAAPH